MDSVVQTAASQEEQKVLFPPELVRSHRPAASREEKKTFAPARDYSLETGNEKLADEIDFFLLWWSKCNIWCCQIVEKLPD